MQVELLRRYMLATILVALMLVVGPWLGGCSTLTNHGDETSFSSSYAFEVHVAGSDIGDIAQDSAFAGPQPIDRLINQAFNNHPSILAAANRLAAAQEAMRSATAIKDPRLSLVAGVEPVQTAAGPQRTSLSLSQEFPRLAKLDARLSRAQAKIESAQASFDVERERVAEQVRLAYADLFQAERTHNLYATQLELLERVAGIAESKYQTGQIRQQEWKDSLIEIDEMENRRIEQLGRIRVMQSKLAMTIGLHPAIEIETLPSLPTIKLLDDQGIYLDVSNNLNPELRRSLIEMRLRQIDVELAYLERQPDPTLSATWIGVGGSGLSPVTNGRDSVLLGVSVGLPIFRNQLEGNTQNAAAIANSQVQEHRNLKLMQHADVLARYESIASRLDQLQRLEERILPSAEDIFSSSMQEFQVNRVTYERLSDYWQRVYALQVQRVELQVALFKDFASLIRVLGGQLPDQESEPGMPPAERDTPPAQGSSLELQPSIFPETSRRSSGY